VISTTLGCVFAIRLYKPVEPENQGAAFTVVPLQTVQQLLQCRLRPAVAHISIHAPHNIWQYSQQVNGEPANLMIDIKI
jgi:hypothetical protein